jgi:hypothetical protein
MKFYYQTLGNRDYSLLEVLHFGLRLPGVVSSLGAVRDVSVSQWTALRRGADFARLAPGERCTVRNKVELFGARGALSRPSTVALDDLRDISLYQFWRLYSVVRGRLVRHQQDRVIAVNGLGWVRAGEARAPAACRICAQGALRVRALRGSPWRRLHRRLPRTSAAPGPRRYVNSSKTI